MLGYYDAFPFERHPLWQMVLSGGLTAAQVMRAETQHFIRSNVGRDSRKRAAEQAANVSQRAHKLLMETYKEEYTEDETGPSHVDLIKRFLLIGGMYEGDIAAATPTPGNSAAIAMYKDITDRGPLHHMIGAGAVEYFYSGLSPKIFEAYVGRYASPRSKLRHTGCMGRSNQSMRSGHSKSSRRPLSNSRLDRSH